jgi:RNA polymerase sigma-70 factor (ECF subfamily)
MMTIAAAAHEVRLTRPTDTTERTGGATADLARRFAAGDQGALEQVIQRYHPVIARRVGNLLGGAEGVEDLVQEVFLRALERHRQFRADSSLEAWLTGIAVNCCRAAWRRERLRRLLPLRLERRHGDRFPADPASGVEAAERSMQVRRAVARLPAASREVVVLYYLEELSCAEVARMLRLSEQAVRQRLVRARARLERLLSPL